MNAQLAARPASPKQIALVQRLIAEKQVPADTPIPTTHGEISPLIDWLLKAPKKQAVAAPASSTAPLTQGIYLAPNGDVIKVKTSKASGHPYAQVMVAKGSSTRINLHDEIVPAFDFVYTPGLIRHLTPEMKLSLEDAKEFYTKTGRCLNCKKELKVAASIEKGLGPVCAKMFD